MTDQELNEVIDRMLKAAREEQAERDAFAAASGFGTEPDGVPGDCGEIADCGRPPYPYWYGRSAIMWSDYSEEERKCQSNST